MQDTLDQPVMGTEIMPPVRDAVGLVHHEQRYPWRHRSEDLGLEMRIGQPLGGDEQDVCLVALKRGLDSDPVTPIFRVEGEGAHAHALGGGYLVAHEGEQRRNEDGRPGSLLSQQLGGDEID